MEESLLSNKSIKAVAGLLRSFVRDGKFDYVDKIKAVKDSAQFSELLFSALREARENPKAFIPNEIQLEETLNFAKEKLEEVKRTIAIYVLSFPRKGG